MASFTTHQLLTIGAWFLVAILIGFMLLIARFFAQLTNIRTYYSLFGIPIALFGGAAARYAFTDQLFDPYADGLVFVGGLVLVVLCLMVYYQLTSKNT